jgi:16S rRNA processing protein RimM
VGSGPPAPAEYLIVGRIRRPHGVRGELAVAIETDRPRSVFRRGKVLRLGDAEGEPTGGDARIEKARPTTGGVILTLDGVTSREGAEELRGKTLLIAAREAAPAGEEEVHYRDLIGLVTRVAGVEIGRVMDVLSLPDGETLVVQDAAGKEILVPFVKEVVTGIDLEARVLTIDPPEGLLDL